MSNIAGEIYFIAEEPSVSAPPVRVKIGLVRESKENRDSRDRLLDHQTGNPRNLVLLEAIKTARVSQIENSLHQRYASQRGIGEWFELTKPELTLAIAECHELAEQQSVHLPVIRKAESLKFAERNGIVVAASGESTEWHQKHQVAKASESVFSKLKTEYKEKIVSAHEAGADISRYAAVAQARLTLNSWLLEHHRDAHEACKRSSQSEPFTPKSATFDAALNQSEKELAEEFRARLEEWTLETGFEELHRVYLETRRPSSIWKEEKDLALAYLKVSCGQNQEIDGICSWQTRTSNKFSAEIAEEKYPDLVQAHEMLEVFAKPSYRLRSGDDSGD